MEVKQKSLFRQLMIGASVVAVSMASTTVYAQSVAEEDEDEIVATGIRQSLKQSMDIKRNAQGVVDAISAEDIGKFPDTNLAESLQRITGVSIDRSLGEGSSVTVRGFGADFNVVTFNGRTMPTSTLGDGASAPSSRSFDFGNLASEAISSVEVYKTSKASIPTGGIGATLNIKTTRPLEAPGLNATVGFKAVADNSQLDGADVTPEISGLYSNTFANDRLGIAVSGSYQHRKGGVAQANVGWRDGYLGSDAFENEWGRLPRPGSWNYIDGVINSPGPNDVYAVPQNADYELADFERKRINGQATLQYDLSDNLRATADFTYSRNKVEVEKSTAGIWFDHGFTNSAWTDGPIAGPLYYTEFFGQTDLSYSGSLAANKSENKSLGFNLEWQPNEKLGLELDFHDSSAESEPDNRFGSNMSLGTTVIGITEQSINFENELPVISFVGGANGLDPESAADRELSGSAFRNAYMRSDVQQLQLKGDYALDFGLIDSVDFGGSWTNSKVKSQFGVIQTDAWGGELGSPADIPDDLFEWTTLPNHFEGISGADDPNMLQGFYRFDFAAMADLGEERFGICSNSWSGTAQPGTCLAERTTDRGFKEETLSAFIQVNNTFELFGRDANFNAGLRYEDTKIDATAVIDQPVGTVWASANELFYINDGTFTVEDDGNYDYLLPSFDLDFQPLEYVKVRGAYSKTITRPLYSDMQAGVTLNAPFRVAEATGSRGNPNLQPYESDNFDASVEWYHGDDSYISIGYFNKKVENFIGTQLVDEPIFGLTNPGMGPRVDAAVAALGAMATAQDIRAYIAANFPQVLDNGDPNRILGQADDDPLIGRFTTPFNNDQTAKFNGWEFAIQHTFGESGFGVIANYTIINSDFNYDNTQPYTVPQFAVPGLSNSANLIGFYDKNGIQARVAYNWRDEFLAASGNNPFYVEAYGQVDANVSYEFDNGVSIFAEGINILGTDRRGHRRSDNTVTFMNNGKSRYAFGARYKF